MAFLGFYSSVRLDLPFGTHRCDPRLLSDLSSLRIKPRPNQNRCGDVDPDFCWRSGYQLRQRERLLRRCRRSRTLRKSRFGWQKLRSSRRLAFALAG